MHHLTTRPENIANNSSATVFYLEDSHSHPVLESWFECEVDLRDDLVAALHSELVRQAAALPARRPLLELQPARPVEMVILNLFQRLDRGRAAGERGREHLRRIASKALYLHVLL